MTFFLLALQWQDRDNFSENPQKTITDIMLWKCSIIILNPLSFRLERIISSQKSELRSLARKHKSPESTRLKGVQRRATESKVRQLLLVISNDFKFYTATEKAVENF